MRRALRACVCACALLAGCERRMHDMYEQPRYDAGAASPLFADGRAERPPPPGAVPMAAGTLAATSSGRVGSDVVAQWRVANDSPQLPAITTALLARGQERYGIYCLPCHSAVGDGDGPVVRRGFPRPPSYHEQRLRDAPDRHFYDVISNGYGIMHSYADRVAPADRWAIVAYVRALQWSQNAPVAQLPPDTRAKLGEAPGGTR